MIDPASSQPTNRPYPPPSNVTAVLQRLRSRNMPERIDVEYLRDIGIPDGTVNRTLFALRFVGLLDGDIPTAALRSIAVSTDEEYHTILSGLLREAYREVFEAIDPADDPQDRIVNFFRRYTPGSQRDRMVVFFLGMCREAGIPTLDGPRLRASNATPGNRAPRPAPRGVRRDGAAAAKPPRPPQTDRKTEAPGIPPALELLVRSLPSIGESLSDSQREQWLKMARETLAFVYPPRGAVLAPLTIDEEDEDDEEA